MLKLGFPGGSVGEESTCNAEDLSLILGSGSSPGEAMGYPLQYSWASLVAQTVKNPPARQETWVGSLGWEDPLESMATHSSILTWRIPMDRGAWQKSDTTERLGIAQHRHSSTHFAPFSPHFFQLKYCIWVYPL